MTMTRGERGELLSLIKKRERVMRATATERSAALLAEYDQQSAKIYHWDEDETWAKARAAGEAAIEKANEQITARYLKLGIPAEFAPSLQLYWSGRGQNQVTQRRAELRRAAKSKIEALETQALAHIEKLSLQAQTEIIAHGLESAAAKAFLDAMPAIEKLMPRLEANEIEQLIDARNRQEYLQ